MVVTASASESASPIRIWKWNPEASSSKQKEKGGNWSMMAVLEWAIKFVIVMAAAAYFLAVIREQVCAYADVCILLPQISKEETMIGRMSAQDRSKGGMGDEEMRQYIRHEMMMEMSTMMMQARDAAEAHISKRNVESSGKRGPESIVKRKDASTKKMDIIVV